MLITADRVEVAVRVGARAACGAAAFGIRRLLFADPRFAISRCPYNPPGMTFPYEEFDLSGVRTYPLASRKSKANAADFATPVRAGSGVAALVDSLPNILAAADFKAVVAAMRAARDGGARHPLGPRRARDQDRPRRRS